MRLVASLNRTMEDSLSRHQPNDVAGRLWLRSLAVGALGALAIAVPLRLATGPAPPGSSHEWVDTLTWALLLLLTGAGLGLVCLGRFPTGRAGGGVNAVIATVVILGAAISIAWVEPLPGLEGQLWFGFGTPILIAALAIVPLIYLLVHHASSGVLRFVFLASATLALVVYLPSVLQPHWGVMDAVTSSYVINEVLGPSQGHFALGNQTAQYTALFGLPLAPLVHVFGSPLALALGYLSLLATLTIVGLVCVAWLVLPYRLRFLSVLLVVPLVLVKVQPPVTPQGSLTVSLSALPCRLAPLVGMALLLVYALRKMTWHWMAAAGFLGGCAAVNNVEFGTPVLIAAGVVLVLGSRSWRPGRGALAFLVGAVSPAVLYTTLLLLVGQGPQWSAWWAFAAAFGSGFGAIAMPPVGPHVLIVMLLLGGVLAGAYWLRRLANAGVNSDAAPRPRLLAAAGVAAFFGLAGLGSFGYFAGRSVVSIQLQVFLVYIAPIICAQFSLVALPRLQRDAPWATIAGLTALLIPSALATAALLQSPDASYEWRRVTAGIAANHVGSPYDEDAAVTLADLKEVRATTGLVVRGSAVPAGNIRQALTGLVNYSSLDWPLDRTISTGLLERYCRRLADAPSAIYVRDFLNPDGTPGCPGYDVLVRLPSGAQVIRSRG